MVTSKMGPSMKAWSFYIKIKNNLLWKQPSFFDVSVFEYDVLSLDVTVLYKLYDWLLAVKRKNKTLDKNKSCPFRVSDIFYLE